MQSSLYTNVKLAIVPYLKTWDEWITSDYCFLSDQELRFVTLFLHLKSVRAVVKRTKRSERTTRNILRDVRIKLVGGVRIYRYWRKRKTDKYYPLTIPIACINAPKKSKRKLHPIADVLIQTLTTYTISDLRKIGLSIELIKDLRLLLNQYGYPQFMRDRTVQRKRKKSSTEKEEPFAKVLYPPTAGEEKFRRKYLRFLLPLSSNTHRNFAV